ncbi:MAG: hypothetical protein ACKOYC_02290 [Bacteroidota bacterium]
MGFKRITPFVLSLLLLISSDMLAQRIKDKFELMVFSENFDSPSDIWSVEANSDNLFVIQDGEYIFQRKNSQTPYVVFAGLENPIGDCRLVTSIRIEKNMGSDAHAGILFMMQPEASGGFLVELNKKKEYRIRQIAAGVYRYLTGNKKNNGWTKCSAANEAGINNIIEVKMSAGTYDVFINDIYQSSFFEPAYKSGNIGIVVGPDSRARVDFVYVFGKGSALEPEMDESTSESDPQVSSTDGAEIIKLAESIIQLRTQINDLKKENEDLKRAMSTMRMSESEKTSEIKSLESDLKSLQDQLSQKEVEITKLTSEKNELLKYKEMAGGNENVDLVISLSKALKAEKEKTLKLEEELRKLKSGAKQ